MLEKFYASVVGLCQFCACIYVSEVLVYLLRVYRVRLEKSSPEKTAVSHKWCPWLLTRFFSIELASNCDI